jgi:hypothetical protein
LLAHWVVSNRNSATIAVLQGFLAGIARTIGSARTKKTTLTAALVAKVVKAISADTVAGLLDRALLLLQFAAALRVSERLYDKKRRKAAGSPPRAGGAGPRPCGNWNIFLAGSGQWGPITIQLNQVVAAVGISADDLMITLYEVPGENISFGRGLAQRAHISSQGPEPVHADHHS